MLTRTGGSGAGHSLAYGAGNVLTAQWGCNQCGCRPTGRKTKEAEAKGNGLLRMWSILLPFLPRPLVQWIRMASEISSRRNAQRKKLSWFGDTEGICMDRLLITSSPPAKSTRTVQGIMLDVVMALIPAAIAE